MEDNGVCLVFRSVQSGKGKNVEMKKERTFDVKKDQRETVVAKCDTNLLSPGAFYNLIPYLGIFKVYIRLQRDPARGAQQRVGHDAAREQARGRRLLGGRPPAQTHQARQQPCR